LRACVSRLNLLRKDATRLSHVKQADETKENVRWEKEGRISPLSAPSRIGRNPLDCGKPRILTREAYASKENYT
jgi:hypothetical protein